jgi:hypothetical protein
MASEGRGAERKTRVTKMDKTIAIKLISDLENNQENAKRLAANPAVKARFDLGKSILLAKGDEFWASAPVCKTGLEVLNLVKADVIAAQGAN